MTTELETLMSANLLRVFGERDEARRLVAIDEVYTDDITFSDPDEVVSGKQALNDKVATLLAGAPGFVFTEVGPVRRSQDLAILGWSFGPEGAPPVVSGIDVVTVRDGRIATLHTILD